MTEEVWGILINVNNVAIGAEEHQSLVTIGLDTSGGSSFTDFINHLVCGPANAYSEPGSGVWYYCPLGKRLRRCPWRIAKFLNISCEVTILLGSFVRDLAILFLHLLTTTARLAGPGGARSVVAESLLVKQQLLILNRSRKRSPRLRLSDRIIAGLCALLMRPRRLLRSAIVLKPSTLFRLHRALTPSCAKTRPMGYAASR